VFCYALIEDFTPQFYDFICLLADFL